MAVTEYLRARLRGTCRQFHKKERTLKALKRKALDKNPDEFYFKMVRTRLKVGLLGVICALTRWQHPVCVYTCIIYVIQCFVWVVLGESGVLH